MMLPKRGDRYPAGGEHRTHVAEIADVDLHGQQSWEELRIAPTMAVACSCGQTWTFDLDEVVAQAC